MIDLARIEPDPNQPRKTCDAGELAELAANMKAVGQLTPARVWWDAARERYVLIAGERRWRAAQMAGLPHLECVVHDGPLSECQRRLLALVDNIMRADLNPIERAHCFRDILREKQCSARQLARDLGLDPSTVLRSVALLDEPPETQESIIAGRIVPASLRSKGAKKPAAWKKDLAAAGGVTVTVAASRQLTFRAMAAALREVADGLEADGRRGRGARRLSSHKDARDEKDHQDGGRSHFFWSGIGPSLVVARRAGRSIVAGDNRLSPGWTR